MDKINNWALTVSAVSVISGLLLYIVPKSSQKKYFRVIVTIILVYASFLPFVSAEGIDFNIGDFLSDNYQVSEKLDKYALNSMVQSAEKAIENLLTDKAEKAGFTCRFECNCEIINDDISVKSVIAFTENVDTRKQEIIGIIADLGFSESILVFEGE